MCKIGERIKKRRLQLGLSADDVAIAIGKNRATIYRYENEDISNIPISALEPLAKVLKTTPGYFMGWSSGENCKINNLSVNQSRIVKLFDLLTESQQENIIGRAEILAEQNEENQNQENIG